MGTAILTWKVSEYQRASGDDVQLALNSIGATLILLDGAVRGEAVLPAADHLLQQANRRHIRQAGAELGDEDENRKDGHSSPWGEPLLGWSLPLLTVHLVACGSRGTVAIAAQIRSARRTLGASWCELLEGDHLGRLGVCVDQEAKRCLAKFETWRQNWRW